MRLTLLTVFSCLFFQATNLMAATAKPSFQILWDHRGTPHSFIDTGSPGDGSSDMGNFNIEVVSHLRNKFPSDRTFPDNYDPSKFLVSTSTKFNQELESLGLFPDFMFTSARNPVVGKAYMTFSDRGLLNENLSDYNLLIISQGTSRVRPYTPAEIIKIRSFVKFGGKLLVMSENFWTARANTEGILNSFGVSSTMNLVASYQTFSGIFSGVGPFRSDGGTALCLGSAPGWHFDYQQSRDAEPNRGTGLYTKLLNELHDVYRPLPKNELCVPATGPSNVQSLGKTVYQDHTFNYRYEVDMVFALQYGDGDVVMMADSSWVINHVFPSPNAKLFLEKMLNHFLR